MKKLGLLLIIMLFSIGCLETLNRVVQVGMENPAVTKAGMKVLGYKFAKAYPKRIDELEEQCNLIINNSVEEIVQDEFKKAAKKLAVMADDDPVVQIFLAEAMSDFEIYGLEFDWASGEILVTAEIAKKIAYDFRTGLLWEKEGV